jgi:hypothetical protein
MINIFEQAKNRPEIFISLCINAGFDRTRGRGVRTSERNDCPEVGNMLLINTSVSSNTYESRCDCRLCILVSVRGSFIL